MTFLKNIFFSMKTSLPDFSSKGKFHTYPDINLYAHVLFSGIKIKYKLAYAHCVHKYFKKITFQTKVC